MTPGTKLRLIKLGHTAIWVFFNVVIFYMLYAVIVNKLDGWLWTGLGLVAMEGLVLLIFKWYCPLTVLARRYSDSPRENFDIYLPEWLAKHTKRIYTTLVLIIIVMVIMRLILRP